MKTINRKPLFLALAGVTALGAVSTAQAVSVSATGLGSVLLYPYYTVKGDTNPFNTLISIVNTTASTKVVKVRFREGKASAEVLDFNLFLSPYDVWVAGLSPDAAGGVRLATPDKSCTIPKIPSTGVVFRNTAYRNDVLADSSLARLREGYLEVIEMASFYDDSPTAQNAKHDETGTPNCAGVTDTGALSDATTPFGGLTGTAQLVSPGSGLNAATDPTVLVNFRDDEFYVKQDQPPNNGKPDLGYADPWSITPTDFGETIWARWDTNPLTTDLFGNTIWKGGANAVSAALMKNAIINEFVLAAVTNSATDWVVTFPTKHLYVDAAGAAKPFQNKLVKTLGACDDISIAVWNREEQIAPDFSPSGAQLCWEANVVSFNGKNVFSSTNGIAVDTLFSEGWAQINFHPLTVAYALTTNYAVIAFPGGYAGGYAPWGTEGYSTYRSTGTFTGLPVIGFAVQTFRVAANNSYAGTFYHRFLSGINDVGSCNQTAGFYCY
jgi:hypothetical protein